MNTPGFLKNTILCHVYKYGRICNRIWKYSIIYPLNNRIDAFYHIADMYIFLTIVG
jgi:hypothetical protein